MKITKLGHCCLLIEVAGKRLLTDPGLLSVEQNNLTDLDIILITHEHTDHLHTDSLTEIMANNPKAEIICNQSVGKIIYELGFNPSIIDGRRASVVAGVPIEAYDGAHATIYENFGQVQNTGYFIAESLFYPGDAYTEPQKPVPVLALPVSGPWCRIGDVITYLKAVAPKQAFPVHDGLLNDAGLEITYQVIEKNLNNTEIEFKKLKAGETITL